jgi:hypothetical protein
VGDANYLKTCQALSRTRRSADRELRREEIREIEMRLHPGSPHPSDWTDWSDSEDSASWSDLEVVIPMPVSSDKKALAMEQHQMQSEDHRARAYREWSLHCNREACTCRRGDVSYLMCQWDYRTLDTFLNKKPTTTIATDFTQAERTELELVRQSSEREQAQRREQEAHRVKEMWNKRREAARVAIEAADRQATERLELIAAEAIKHNQDVSSALSEAHERGAQMLKSSNVLDPKDPWFCQRCDFNDPDFSVACAHEQQCTLRTKAERESTSWKESVRKWKMFVGPSCRRSGPNQRPPKSRLEKEIENIDDYYKSILRLPVPANGHNPQEMKSRYERAYDGEYDTRLEHEFCSEDPMLWH